MKKLTFILVILVVFINIYSEEKRYSFNFSKTPLSTVLRIMGEQTQRKFLTDEELSERIVSFRLESVTADEALKALLSNYNLYYVKPEGTNIYVIKDRRREPIISISKVIRCNYIQSKTIIDSLKPRISRAGDIKADETTNSIIVNDIADVVAEIEDLVRQLDVPTPQVLIEARIIEMKSDKGLKVGVNVNNLYNSENYWISPLEKKRSEVIEDYKVTEKAVLPEVNFQQIFGEIFGTGGMVRTAVISGGVNIESFIEALSIRGIANVLGNPKVLVMNNNEANIEIVEEIPYQKLTVSEQGQPMVSTEFKEVGIKLRVKPQINPDNTIVLNVSPEQSYRTGESLGNIPIIDKSKTDTTFLLKNGETAVIGGMIREVDSKTQYKIPLLGDIPIIGNLFKRTIKNKTRSELTIFITASIVK